MLSAVSTIAAAILVYWIVIRLPFLSVNNNWKGGLIAAFTFGLAPLIWSQAVITEVYGLHGFFVALILFLLSTYSSDNRRKTFNIVIGLVLALALGNHLSSLLLIPPVFLVGIFQFDKLDGIRKNGRYLTIKIKKFDREIAIDSQSLLQRILGLCVGLLIYLTIPLRAYSGSPVNWENAINLDNFIRLVTGQLYRTYFLNVPWASILIRLQAWGHLWFEQVGLIGLSVGLYGLIFHPKPTWLFITSLWLIVALSFFSVSYNSNDSFVYLIPAILVFSIWIGISASSLLDMAFRYRSWLNFLISFLFLIFLISQTVQNLPKVDASQDNRAEKFGQSVMDTTPQNALIFTSEDNDSFALWYFHYTLRERPDIAVLVTGLLPYDWYRQTLRVIYPQLEIPQNDIGLWQAQIINANPSHPICTTSIAENPFVQCRSNTPANQ